MSKTYVRTVDDVVKLSDDERVYDFCMTAHVHFRARSLSEAVAILAEHFKSVAEGSDSGEHPFDRGQVTVGRVDKIHAQEVTLN